MFRLDSMLKSRSQISQESVYALGLFGKSGDREGIEREPGGGGRKESQQQQWQLSSKLKFSEAALESTEQNANAVLLLASRHDQQHVRLRCSTRTEIEG